MNDYIKVKGLSNYYYRLITGLKLSLELIFLLFASVLALSFCLLLDTALSLGLTAFSLALIVVLIFLSIIIIFFLIYIKSKGRGVRHF